MCDVVIVTSTNVEMNPRRRPTAAAIIEGATEQCDDADEQFMYNKIIRSPRIEAIGHNDLYITGVYVGGAYLRGSYRFTTINILTS